MEETADLKCSPPHTHTHTHTHTLIKEIIKQFGKNKKANMVYKYRQFGCIEIF
jgi:hypothetical protein